MKSAGHSREVGEQSAYQWQAMICHVKQSQHGTDRLHSSAASPCSARQGLRLGTTESNDLSQHECAAQPGGRRLT